MNAFANTLPTLSFIVPMYNVESYIEECLLSILGQIDQFPGSEIIVVDDGSSDGSAAVVERIRHRFSTHSIRLLRQANSGPGGARNTGLDVARGDYVWFVDSDDMLKPDALSVLKAAMQLHPGTDIYVNSLHRTGYGENLLDIRLQEYPVMNARQYMRTLCATCPLQRFTVRRAVIEDCHLRFIPHVVHEDVHFGLILIASAKTFYLLQKPVYNYRLRQGSIMHTITIRNSYDCIRCHEVLMTFCQEQVTDEDKDWFRFCASQALTSSLLHMGPVENHEDIIAFCREKRDYIIEQTRPFPFRQRMGIWLKLQLITRNPSVYFRVLFPMWSRMMTAKWEAIRLKRAAQQKVKNAVRG